jgi:hypothetical protein
MPPNPHNQIAFFLTGFTALAIWSLDSLYEECKLLLKPSQHYREQQHMQQTPRPYWYKDLTPTVRQQQQLIPPQPLQHRQYIQNAGPSADPFRYQPDTNINHPSLRQLQNYPTPYAPQPQPQPQPYQKIYADPTPTYVPYPNPAPHRSPSPPTVAVLSTLPASKKHMGALTPLKFALRKGTSIGFMTEPEKSTTTSR